MEIATVSTTPQSLSKRYKVNEYHILTAEGLTSMPIEFKEDVYITRSVGNILSQELKNNSDESDKNEGEKKPESSTSVKLKDLLGAGSGGSIATGAMKMYQLSNTTPKAELITFFRNNNCTPQVADNMADVVFKFTESSVGKAFFLGTAGGAATYGILELVKPTWTLKKKVLVSFIVAVLIAIIYWVLARIGVMT